MFLLPTKTIITRSLRQAFDATYPVEQFRDLHISIEMPIEPQHYPSIWVDFEPSDQLRTAGINHIEYVEVDGDFKEVRRWRFSGFVTYTCVAMESAVRDQLFDEVVKTIAFGKQDPARARFREAIESNDLIGLNIDWDEIALSGFTATPGTPWNTPDVIYEATARVECIGEFLSLPGVEDLVPLSAVALYPYAEEVEADPTTEGGWT